MRAFPEKFKAMKERVLPKAPVENLPVDPEFIRDLIRSGKAVELKPGEELPPSAEYEIITENGQKRLIHHRVSAR